MNGYHGIDSLAFALMSMRDLQGGQLLFVAGEDDQSFKTLSHESRKFVIKEGDNLVWDGGTLNHAINHFTQQIAERYVSDIVQLLELSVKIVFIGDDGRCLRISWDEKFILEWGADFRFKESFDYYPRAAEAFSALINE